MPATSRAPIAITREDVAARWSMAGAWSFIAIVVLLHIVKPELAPSWRFLSEYAIGDHGWLMRLAFGCWAIGCFSLSLALRPHLVDVAGRVGVGVLLLVALSLVAAALFVMDPVTARPQELTVEGRLHGIAALIGIPGIPFAASLIGWSVWRNPSWSSVRIGVLWAVMATWACLIAMLAYMTMAVPPTGGFGPELLVGWFNRLVVASYIVWQIVVARGALAVARSL